MDIEFERDRGGGIPLWQEEDGSSSSSDGPVFDGIYINLPWCLASIASYVQTKTANAGYLEHSTHQI